MASIEKALQIAAQAHEGQMQLVASVLNSKPVPESIRGIPALMWTDTSEFRNPHYHLPTDMPETLDYEFLAGVTRLLVHAVLSSLRGWGRP